MALHERRPGAGDVGPSEKCRSAGNGEHISDNESPTKTQEHCRHCGGELPQRRKLKLFCCYACRGQFKALAAVGEPTGLVGSKNTRQRRALQCLKQRSIGRFAFTPINTITWRIDAPKKLGAAWVIDIGSPVGVSPTWLARCRNMMHGPHAFKEAKAVAVAMAKGEARGDVLLDPIRLLNYLQAGLIGGTDGDVRKPARDEGGAG